MTWYNVIKGAKIRNQYNQAPKVTNTQFNITNESQVVSPFPAGDHKAAMNRPCYK